jgi:outer membrane lipoprotein-sorting protein
MKRIVIKLGIMAILFVAVLSVVACSSASKTSQITTVPATSAAQTTSAAKTSATSTSTQASGGSVADLLGRAAAITSWKADMVTTAADNSVTTSTAWVKKNKMRIETTAMGQNVVILIDGDAKTMYLYTPSQNTAMKMDFSQAPQSGTADSISQYNPVIIGSETLDGKLCQILQYSVAGVATKEWVWDAKGLPVRTQSTSSSGTTTIDFKNYDFSAIPDNQFVLPAGVQISSLGLPGGLPTALPSGFPTALPSGFPTSLPSGFPTALPSGLLPSGFPTNLPTGLPK